MLIYYTTSRVSRCYNYLFPILIKANVLFVNISSIIFNQNQLGSYGTILNIVALLVLMI